MYLPPDHSKLGFLTDHLLLIVHLGIVVFFLAALSLFFYCLFRKSAPQTRISKLPPWSPLGVALCLGVFEAVLLSYEGKVWDKLRYSPPQGPDVVTIKLQAQQFLWNFYYDDLLSQNELHVPVNRPIKLQMTSLDVIHNFFVPVLRVKQDIIPGHMQEVYFEVTQPGQYDIACAQLCGVGHYRMAGRLIAESQADYEVWLKELKAEAAE